MQLECRFKFDEFAEPQECQNTPRVDEVADGELLRQRLLQPLGVQHQVVVQETCVGVERAHLLGPGLHHVWVAVAHWGDGEKTDASDDGARRGHLHKIPASLRGTSLEHERACVCVFTVCDIVDAVQVALTFLVVHVLTFGFYYLYRVMAEEDLAGGPAEEIQKHEGQESRITLKLLLIINRLLMCYHPHPDSTRGILL